MVSDAELYENASHIRARPNVISFSPTTAINMFGLISDAFLS